MTHPRIDHVSSSAADSFDKGKHRGPQRWPCVAAAVPLFLLLGFAPDCGGSSNGTTSSLSGTDCPETVPTYGELTIWPLCTVCHASSLSGSARQGAPANVNFDTYAAAARAASEAVVEVTAGRMPPPGQTQPTSDQTTALEQWAQCGTPE